MVLVCQNKMDVDNKTFMVTSYGNVIVMRVAGGKRRFLEDKQYRSVKLL